MSKKIGIMTFHASSNCGSMLQALALQDKVEEVTGIKPEMIDFSNEGQIELYKPLGKIISIKKLIKNILLLPIYRKLLKQQKAFAQFMKYFNLTDKSYKYTEELNELDGYYDYLVCGSDQIWNIKCPDADDAYFLCFDTKSKKVAYAPSLGGANLAVVAPDIEKYKRYLDQIEYLSIREVNGKRWIEEITGRNVELVLDPTLLMTKKDWEKYIPKGRIIQGDYIFYYAFHYSKEQNKIVKEISQKLKMPVITIDLKTWVLKGVFLYGVKLSPEFGPSAFLNIISNAKLVLTRSFHGVAFSTIFERKFWMLGRLTNPNGDDRAASILNQLGLTDRMISLEEIKTTDIMKEIDYKAVNLKLKALKENSFEYMKKAFSER